MAFGSLVPGMAPMAAPQMRPNQMMQQGMQVMQLARQMQGQGGAGAQQQGLLQRLLNPPAPTGPTELGAPGMNANGSTAAVLPKFMQAGILPKMLPQLFGGSGGPAPAGTVQPPVPPPTMPPIY